MITIVIIAVAIGLGILAALICFACVGIPSMAWIFGIIFVIYILYVPYKIYKICKEFELPVRIRHKNLYNQVQTTNPIEYNQAQTTNPIEIKKLNRESPYFISETYLKNQVFPKTWRKSWEMYKSGDAFNIHRDNGVIDGSVHSQHGSNIYSTWVKVSNHTIIDRWCSCPSHTYYSWPCKHVIALILTSNVLPLIEETGEVDANDANLCETEEDCGDDCDDETYSSEAEEEEYDDYEEETFEVTSHAETHSLEEFGCDVEEYEENWYLDIDPEEDNSPDYGYLEDIGYWEDDY